jgi:hypothetical protein
VSNPITTFFHRIFIGRQGDHCTECGAPVAAGEGFWVMPGQVYCSEAHAVADQQNNPL